MSPSGRGVSGVGAVRERKLATRRMQAAALVVPAAMLLVGCGERERAAITGAPARGATTAERAYRAPPSVTAIGRLPNGGIVLAGAARPMAQLRLASPAGQALFASADAKGAWRLALGPAVGPRLFGLSMIEAGRALQAEGYIAVMPDGLAAQLRSGAGAIVLESAPAGRPKILAVDFDRGAPAGLAVVISGTGAPGDRVMVFSDDQPRGQTAVGPDGRFSLALDQPLAAGEHRFEVAEGPARDSASLSLLAAAPLTGGPFRAQRLEGSGAGWRIDWLTPGGGEQSTVILGRTEGGE
ncbi:MAG: Ig-like domain-containing protein [Caulobacteraceae bacterium]